MIKPQALSPGDTIGVVAPSSPPKDPNEIDRGIAALKTLGFKVRLGKAVRKRTGYLAGSDNERANDINSMFADPTVDAVMCLRGGYGSPRILDLIDYQKIKKHPKIFCGFSDITALHLAIQKKVGLCTFHGPTVLSGFAKNPTSAYTVGSFLKAVCTPSPIGDIGIGFPKKQYPKPVTICKGRASGKLLGGNLTLITSLVGTQYQPSFSGSILFLEDINEPIYKIDRILTHLLHAGVLKGVRGVALGIWSGCEGDNKQKGEKKISLADMFADKLSVLKIPIVLGLPIGHIDDYTTLPYGVRAELDAGARTLVVKESGVIR